MAALQAGIPYTTSTSTVNRRSSSVLTAVAQITANIAIGSIDIGIGAGVESMAPVTNAELHPRPIPTTSSL